MASYTLPLYDGMEARVTLTRGTVQGTWANGIMFDADAHLIASTPEVLYMDCHAGIVADVLTALHCAHGTPARDWEDSIWDVVAAAGLECTCDDDDK